MAVTPADVAVELGRPTPEYDSIEFAQWTRWIDRARLIIKDRLGALDALDQALLDEVVLLAVAAHAQRPDGSTQVDTRIDDASTSRRYTTSTGRISILDEWWDLLAPATSSGAFTISPFGATDYGPRDTSRGVGCWPPA